MRSLNEDGKTVKDEVMVQADDVGIKIEAELEDEGNVEIDALVGANLPHDRAKLERGP